MNRKIEKQIRKKSKNNRVCLSIFAFVMLLFVPFFVYASETKSDGNTTQVIEEENKTVRVGYFPYANFQEGGYGEHKQGAGYEYLQKISYITGWKYEYVYGSFKECLDMLADGEIDILSFVIIFVLLLLVYSLFVSRKKQMEALKEAQNENAENIVKKKKAGQSEATLDYKIPARTAERTSEDSENKGCGEKQTLGHIIGMKPAMDGDICFRDVSFSYSPDHPVLKNINFTIPSGSTFAILGTTGSGKSTLVHLLNRLYDLPEDCGSITIGCTDIRDIDRQYLRQNIGMVLQEPFLFSRTIRENIGITKEKLLDEEIRHAAEIACVDESILHFADGYDTIVGERGVTLSGGQKQRVAIARMLMKEAPILVFDDSLSAVDTETDNKIRKELKKEMEKATVIMISHRITSLMQADCIIVMDKGVIQQMGTHEELIHQEGPYKDIYEIQMNSDIRLMEGGAACE